MGLGSQSAKNQETPGDCDYKINFLGYILALDTGAVGFIGSNFVLDWLAHSSEPVLSLDALTYAGNLENLSSLCGDSRHVFVRGDIGDAELFPKLFSKFQTRAGCES